MNWINCKGIWVKSVKVIDGNFTTRSSRIKASHNGIKWKDETKTIQRQAEQAIDMRLAREGLHIQRTKDMTLSEVCVLLKPHFNFCKSRMKRIEKELGGEIHQENYSP